MEQNETNRMDAELERITSENKKRFRAAEQAAYSDDRIPNWTETGKIVRRRVQMRRVLYTLARFLPGLVFLAAIPRGWMHPPFACLMVLASFVWGVNYYMRGYRYE